LQAEFHLLFNFFTMFHQHTSIRAVLFSMVIGLCQLSCKKLISVDQPINSITTTQVFETDAQASSAMAGVYTRMINGGSLSFSNGYSTLLGGMSADELFYYQNATADAHLMSFGTNQLVFNNSHSSAVWTTAYRAVYGANAVIEGVAASKFSTLTDSARTELTAQAKFVRAFSYFYLINFFGDVPLVLTVDFNKTRYMARTPINQVYEQIIQDLKDAQAVLPADYSTSGANNGRVIPNKWAATALLARTYLYTGDYANAAAEATAVINSTSLYSLETDLNKVFLNNSKEAIWQLKQGLSEGPLVKNATREGYAILPNPLRTGISRYCVTTSLLNTFEPGDLRRKAWIDSTNNTPAGAGSTPQGFTRFPYKYKLGEHNAVGGAASSEYYTVFRLAEMYLVRAEAAAHGVNGGTAAAIADLNIIRARATLPALPADLTTSQVMAAVAKERLVELFAEWGHRWFDLKRTGKAHDVLSAIPPKQPWAGDYQLLYPIPPVEIEVDPRMEQNPGY
jgi:hypothetical protein